MASATLSSCRFVIASRGIWTGTSPSDPFRYIATARTPEIRYSAALKVSRAVAPACGSSRSARM